jgi:preprotein translocase subunit SecB
MDSAKQPGLQINQVILLEAHFAHRKDALQLPSTTLIGDLPVQIEQKIAGKPGEQTAVIGLRAFTAENVELLYSFSVEVVAIISTVAGEENLDPFEYANQMGPAAFFPFLREAIANLTMKGRFGPLWLKPINLVALGGVQSAALPDTTQSEA